MPTFRPPVGVQPEVATDPFSSALLGGPLAAVGAGGKSVQELMNLIRLILKRKQSLVTAPQGSLLGLEKTLQSEIGTSDDLIAELQRMLGGGREFQ